MSGNEMYGDSLGEQHLEKITACREIVKKIVDFGVTQEQLILIIQGLSYELENHEHMVELVALTKEILAAQNPILFVQKA